MIAFALSPCPPDAALVVTVFGCLCSPYRNRPLHHPHAGGKTEIIYHVAGPPVALMAGVVTFRFSAVPYRAYLAPIVNCCRCVRLHAAQALSFFKLCSIQVRHNRSEFFIFVPGSEVNAAGAAIQAAWC